MYCSSVLTSRRMRKTNVFKDTVLHAKNSPKYLKLQSACIKHDLSATRMHFQVAEDTRAPSPKHGRSFIIPKYAASRVGRPTPVLRKPQSYHININNAYLDPPMIASLTSSLPGVSLRWYVDKLIIHNVGLSFIEYALALTLYIYHQTLKTFGFLLKCRITFVFYVGM